MSATKTPSGTARSDRCLAWAALAHAGTTLCLITLYRPGPDVFSAGFGRLVVLPSILLLTMCLVGGALVWSSLAARKVARDLARRCKEGPEHLDVPPGPTGIVMVSAALLVGLALSLAMAGHAVLDLADVWVVTALVPAVVAIHVLGRNQERIEGVGANEVVRQHRGVSMVLFVIGLTTAATSGSVTLASFLPAALAAHLPTMAATQIASASTLGSEQSEGSPSQAAGEAIHALTYAGSPKAPDRLERHPARAYEPWWPLDREPPLPIPPHQWADDLPALMGSLSTAQMEYLRRLASHPATREFEAIRGAGRADIVATRWQPLGTETLTAFELPVPRFVELWNGARARIASGFVAHADGNRRLAERRIRDVEHLGVLLVQDGPLPIDGVVGAALIEEAARALAHLSRNSPARSGVAAGGGGRPPVGVARPEDGTSSAEPAATTSPIAATAPDGPLDRADRWSLVQDRYRSFTAGAGTKAAHWEAFTLLNTFLPCASPGTVLLGEDRHTLAWRDQARGELVATPAEDALFGVLAHGYLGTRAGDSGWGWFPKTLALTLGSRPAVTHCAPMLVVLTAS